MTKRMPWVVFACAMVALCLALSGCDQQIDESLLDAQADLSVKIALPYATVAPRQDESDALKPLVIDAEGGVTVNDSASILDGDAQDQTDVDSNYKSLRQGNTGLAVQTLQARLRELGYFTSDISGIFDAGTEAAVRRFEQTYGTMQTGVATAELQTRLFSSEALVYASDAYNDAVVSQYTILERGDVGSSVYALQQRLKNLGYPIDELTGVFDNETANALMLFYEAYGMTASDIANVALQKELYSDSARAYEGGAGATGLLNTLSESALARVQQRLIDLGYLAGAADGLLDRRTEIGVKLFEEACGQLPSGMLSADVQDVLFSDGAPAFSSFAAQYANLLEGSSGESVRLLQQRLVTLGFAAGTPNGEYGSATTSSVKLFQRANALEETGVASAYMQAVLYSTFALNINGETALSVAGTLADDLAPETPAPTAQSGSDDQAVSAYERLSVGSTGEAVLRLQNRLTELGYVTSITGTYDNLTGRAVSAFQSTVGVESSGIATPELLAFLYCKAAVTSGNALYDTVQGCQTLKSGDSGDAVTALQKRLWELKYLSKEAVADSVGSYAQVTIQAVIDVQTALGYEAPDGIAGAELQCYLFSEQALSVARGQQD